MAECSFYSLPIALWLWASGLQLNVGYWLRALAERRAYYVATAASSDAADAPIVFL